MAKRLTFEEVKIFIESIENYKLLSSQYKNSHTKLEVKCSKGHVFFMSHSDIKQGKRCLECQGIIRWNHEKVKEFIEVTSGSNYKLLSTEYRNAHQKLKIKCDKGHIYDVSFTSFYHTKTRCPRCKGKGKLSYHDVKKNIEIESNSGYKLLSKDYKNNRSKIDLMCPEGHIYRVQYSSFQQGNRCKTCSEINKIRRQTHTYEYVKRIIEEAGYQLLSKEYIDNEAHMEVICDNGHKYRTSFGNFLTKRCKKCYHIRNSGSGNSRWNPNLTDEEREMKRNIEGYSEWRLSVFERDSYSCISCGDDKGGNLNAHHKDGYNWCKERRTDITNGVTLCDNCHNDFHSNYGFGNNTEEQYNKWIITKTNNLIQTTTPTT